MITPSTFRGAILAGGESRRMGRDKALLDLAGEPLWRRQERVLREAGCTEVMIVRRPGQPDLAPGIPHVHDTIADAGPIAGLHAALTFNLTRPEPACGELVELLEAACPEPVEGLVVLAVDMPAIDAGWFAWLREACRPGRGAVARHADGFEPLAAIYPAEALPLLKERLRRREFSLQGLLAALAAADCMTVLPLPESDRPKVANWNSPQDLR
jgi:molybdopterin-guanine dinucleotide biosynthesis protein A